MEQELIKIFDNICEQNKKYISQNGTMSPMAFFIDKNNHLEIVLMVIKNPTEKELFKRLIKAKALMSEIKGYILVMDSVMTSLNSQNKDIAKTQETVVTQLFTAQETLSRFMIHKGKKIIEEEIPDGFKIKTDWNIWSEGMNMDIKEEKEICEWYHQYKQDNPDKYKDVA